ncbi:MAG: hypothetical protein K5886_00925, partial [Lachnospiraceae bacterium]|nr:hypothetical protein [Lachnospiraceae bacterium]
SSTPAEAYSESAQAPMEADASQYEEAAADMQYEAAAEAEASEEPAAEMAGPEAEMAEEPENMLGIAASEASYDAAAETQDITASEPTADTSAKAASAASTANKTQNAESEAAAESEAIDEDIDKTAGLSEALNALGFSKISDLSYEPELTGSKADIFGPERTTDDSLVASFTDNKTNTGCLVSYRPDNGSIEILAIKKTDTKDEYLYDR